MHIKNVLIGSLIVISGVFVSSCGGDGDCTAADLIGTYTGQSKCPDEDAIPTFIKIEDRQGQLFLVDEDGGEFPITVSGCDFSIPPVNLLFATVSGNGSVDGSELELDLKLEALGLSETCKFVGQK